MDAVSFLVFPLPCLGSFSLMFILLSFMLDIFLKCLVTLELPLLWLGYGLHVSPDVHVLGACQECGDVKRWWDL